MSSFFGLSSFDVSGIPSIKNSKRKNGSDHHIRHSRGQRHRSLRSRGNRRKAGGKH
jgi:hypothetical protein